MSSYLKNIFKAPEKFDVTLFGSIRILLIGSAIIIFLVGIIYPSMAQFIVNRTFEFIASIFKAILGVVVIAIALILTFIEWLGLEIIDIDAWRNEQVNNLNILIDSILTIAYTVSSSTLTVYEDISPLDDWFGLAWETGAELVNPIISPDPTNPIIPRTPPTCKDIICSEFEDPTGTIELYKEIILVTIKEFLERF